MGFLDGLFSSPREREAPGLYKEQRRKYDDLYNSLGSEQGQFEGINSLADIESRFGIKPFDVGGYQSQVGGVFNPLKQNLNTQAGIARKKSFSQYGNMGTPEFATQGINANLSQELGDLQSQEASNMLRGFDMGREQDNFTGGFLRDILGEKQGYGERKYGRKLATLGARGGSLQDYLNSLSGASTFNDILSVAGTASKFLPTGA